MNYRIPQPRHPSPRDLRLQRANVVWKSLGGLAYDLQHSNCGIDSLLVGCKFVKRPSGGIALGACGGIAYVTDVDGVDPRRAHSATASRSTQRNMRGDKEERMTTSAGTLRRSVRSSVRPTKSKRVGV